MNKEQLKVLFEQAVDKSNIEPFDDIFSYLDNVDECMFRAFCLGYAAGKEKHD